MDKWEKAMVVFTLIMSVGTLIMAGTSIWNSVETRELANLQRELFLQQTTQKIYFNAEAPLTFPNKVCGNNQYINYSIFHNTPYISVEAINNGPNPIKIKGVYMYGSCLKNYNSANVLSISPFGGTFLNINEIYKFNYILKPSYLKDENLSLPCEVDFVVYTDNLTQLDKITLVDNLNSVCGMENNNAGENPFKNIPESFWEKTTAEQLNLSF